MQKKEQEETFEQLTQIAEKQEENENKEDKKEINIDLKSLYEINQEIAGWLKIEDTNINYPVMKSTVCASN